MEKKIEIWLKISWYQAEIQLALADWDESIHFQKKFFISKWRRWKKEKLFLFELVGKSIWTKMHDLCVLNEFTSTFKWRSLCGVMNIRGKTYLCWFGASLVIGDRAGYPAVRGLPVIKYSERKKKRREKNEIVDKFSISTQWWMRVEATFDAGKIDSVNRFFSLYIFVFYSLLLRTVMRANRIK